MLLREVKGFIQMHVLKRNMCFLGLLLVIIAMAGCSEPSMPTTSASHVELNVCAGLGMSDAFMDINDLYMQKNKNITIIANFAASGTLQRQIEQGAPADVFVSAAAKQMDALQDGGLIINETRQDLLNNRVMLIVPGDGKLGISSFLDLRDDNVEKIAIGDPEYVPAGAYGEQALQKLGIYEQVQSKLILCNDVRQVLAYVEGGNVDAGIVYATDAAISTSVKVVASAPAEINSKIVFPVAVVRDSKNVVAAEAYINFLFSDEAKVIFEQYGFVVLNK